jgi:hypothetical protein
VPSFSFLNPQILDSPEQGRQRCQVAVEKEKYLKEKTPEDLREAKVEAGTSTKHQWTITS